MCSSDLKRPARAIDNFVALAQEELASLMAQVRTLSPQATLDRGYAVVQTETGEIVRKAKTLKEGDRIAIRVAQGVVAATTNGVKES